MSGHRPKRSAQIGPVVGRVKTVRAPSRLQNYPQNPLATRAGNAGHSGRAASVRSADICTSGPILSRLGPPNPVNLRFPDARPTLSSSTGAFPACGEHKSTALAQRSSPSPQNPPTGPIKGGGATAAPPMAKPAMAKAQPRSGWAGRKSYAAIDLGTNNCRLLIARPSADGFVVVDAFSRIVRLGEGLAGSGRISDAAIERAIAALTICAEKLKRRHVTLARSVATEACRRASNGNDFIERVYRETGIALDIITAQEEARLAVLGCHALLEPGDGPALIFDIGGGSTELVLVDTNTEVPRILDWQSAPWGVVSLTESEIFDPESPSARLTAYARMRERVTDAFQALASRLPRDADDIRLLGTSGTVTTLASLHLELPRYDRQAIDGLIVPSEAMRGISSRLAQMSIAERRQLPCIGNERADLVVAGCAILECILDIWPAKSLGVADRGIREGILRGLMDRDGNIR